MRKFGQLYEKERKKIDKKLAGALTKKKPSSLYKPAEYVLGSGGKRLRPLLVLFASRAVGGDPRHGYNAAMAVEMLHNFTLVHDDIMDNSAKRRGLVTLHKKYDLSTAILVGDGLLAVAYEYLLKDAADVAGPVVNAFTHALVEVCEGQSYDKDFEVRKSVSIAEYRMMIRKKTAAMAEMCLRIGAMIGGGSKKQVDALGLYGRNLGLAFQVQDDLLDIMGTEEFGKPIGGDLIEGKKTYLFLRALEKAKGKDKKQLQQIITNKGCSQSEVAAYREMYERLGVLDDAGREIRRYTKTALNKLQVIEREEERELFDWLAHKLVKRTA